MPTRRKIGLLPGHPVLSPGSILPVMEGLLEYGKRQGQWHLYHIRNPEDLAIRSIDGLLVPLGAPTRRDESDRFGDLPRVHLINRNTGDSGPSVLFDDVAIGAQAADHLLERGLEHFGYCDIRHPVSRLRSRGFARRVAEAGYTVSRASVAVGGGPTQAWQNAHDHDLLARWLKRLPAPAGVLAFSDHTAFDIIEVALAIGLRVPDDLAVVGINNELLRCEFCEVPISSVDRDGRRVGMEAGALLDRMIEGEDVPDQVLVPPAGVVVRGSSDVLAIEDGDVVRALRIIRAEACDELTVEAILDRVPISRSSLERRFRKAIGRSPHAEMRRVRLGRAKELLLATTMNLAQIAVRCGFSSPSYLSKAFADAFGLPPSDYRRAHQRPQAM